MKTVGHVCDAKGHAHLVEAADQGIVVLEVELQSRQPFSFQQIHARRLAGRASRMRRRVPFFFATANMPIRQAQLVVNFTKPQCISRRTSLRFLRGDRNAGPYRSS